MSNNYRINEDGSVSRISNPPRRTCVICSTSTSGAKRQIEKELILKEIENLKRDREKYLTDIIRHRKQAYTYVIIGIIDIIVDLICFNTISSTWFGILLMLGIFIICSGIGLFHNKFDKYIIKECDREIKRLTKRHQNLSL